MCSTSDVKYLNLDQATFPHEIKLPPKVLEYIKVHAEEVLPLISNIIVPHFQYFVLEKILSVLPKSSPLQNSWHTSTSDSLLRAVAVNTSQFYFNVAIEKSFLTLFIVKGGLLQDESFILSLFKSGENFKNTYFVKNLISQSNLGPRIPDGVYDLILQSKELDVYALSLLYKLLATFPKVNVDDKKEIKRLEVLIRATSDKVNQILRGLHPDSTEVDFFVKHEYPKGPRALALLLEEKVSELQKLQILKVIFKENEDIRLSGELAVLLGLYLVACSDNSTLTSDPDFPEILTRGLKMITELRDFLERYKDNPHVRSPESLAALNQYISRLT